MAKLGSTTIYGDEIITGNLKVKNGKFQIDNTAVTASADELNHLDGITATASELNHLDGISSTVGELNKLHGYTGTKDDLNYAKDLHDTGVTATEFNTLDGITATTAELNKLDGVTATTAELNKLDGVTATTAELNHLDGITSSVGELNKLHGFTGDSTDLNYAKDLKATGVTSAEFNTLDGITATTAELNKLHGATISTAELNKLEGIDYNIKNAIDLNTAKKTNVTTNLSTTTSTTTVTVNSSDGTDASIPAATTTKAGVMASTDKVKLDGIATNANKYIHPSYTARTESIDTGAMTGAKVLSDLDINLSSDSAGHVTSCDFLMSTRSLTHGDVGAAASSHTHGSISNDGKIGTTSGLMIKTTTGGALSTLAKGSSGQFLAYDGSWKTPPNTTYGTVSTTANGLAPKITSTSKYLRGDGTWSTPTNTWADTNISVTENESTVTINSSTGSDDSIAAATTTKAGVMTSTDKTDLTTLKGTGTIQGVSTGNSPTFVKVTAPLTGDVTGNADTATKLKTARTIGGVSFDGSKNINLPGVNSTGNQSTTGNAATATKVSATAASDSTADLIVGTMADNDRFRIRIGGSSDEGYAEIATADGSTEPIYVRQYNGSFTTLTRTATLLDGSGDTTFPGKVYALEFHGRVYFT